MKLSDEVISHVAQILQIAIISGTDIVDNLRMIRLIEENNELYLDPVYEKTDVTVIQVSDFEPLLQAKILPTKKPV